MTNIQIIPPIRSRLDVRTRGLHTNRGAIFIHGKRPMRLYAFALSAAFLAGTTSLASAADTAFVPSQELCAALQAARDAQNPKPQRTAQDDACLNWLLDRAIANAKAEEDAARAEAAQMDRNAPKLPAE